MYSIIEHPISPPSPHSNEDYAGVFSGFSIPFSVLLALSFPLAPNYEQKASFGNLPTFNLHTIMPIFYTHPPSSLLHLRLILPDFS
jgi:hypothetical protein